MTEVERESMEFDLLVVGAGPAGLAAAIRAKQQALATGAELSVCVIEKAAEIGAHILSGAVMDPRALTELLPDWKERGAPLDTPVTRDQVLFLSEIGAHAVPHALLIRANEVLQERFEIRHSTLQVETGRYAKMCAIAEDACSART